MSNPNKLAKSVKSALRTKVDPAAAILNAALLGHKWASYKDLGYAAAVVSDAKLSLGRSALADVPGFPDAIPDEIAAEIKAGIKVRKAEIMLPVTYRKRDGDVYTPIAADETATAKDWTVNVGLVLSYTADELGKLKKADPARRRMLQEWKTEINKYVSNAYNGLIGAAKAGQPRERTDAVSFANYVKKFMDELPKKAKNCLARNDATAPDAGKLTKAIAAFVVELK